VDEYSPEFNKEDVCCLALCNDGRLASGGMDGLILLWTLPSRMGDRASSLTAKLFGHIGCVNALTTLPGASYLASGGRDGTVRLWNVTLGAQVAQFDGHGGNVVHSLLFLPQNGELVSGCADGSVRVWDTPKTGGGVGRGSSSQTGSNTYLGFDASLLSESYTHTLKPEVAGLGDSIFTMVALSNGKVASGGLSSHIRVWATGDVDIKWRPELSPSPKSPKSSPRSPGSSSRMSSKRSLVDPFPPPLSASFRISSSRSLPPTSIVNPVSIVESTAANRQSN